MTRRADPLTATTREVRGIVAAEGIPDRSELDAMTELADRAEALFERLRAILDWADFALRYPQVFDSHGVKNLDGPVFDSARAELARAEGLAPSRRQDP